jgi:diguanylate cyclase (GGDEF)-like protein
MDLTDCDLEPIHTPGQIQPHGVVIATEPNSDRISHVSGNLQASTGLDPRRVLGAALPEVLGPAAFDTLQSALLSGAHLRSKVLALTLPFAIDAARDVFVHRHQGRIIVELEPPSATDDDRLSVALYQRVIAGLSEARTVEALCAAAATRLRDLTGYDRVMVYRFGAGGHGTVIAEDKAEALEPYLGLRYPASDIPKQARRLYLLQRLRTIPDACYAPAPILAAPGATGDLDMTYCGLRGVSPVHLEYLANMGVRATMTISLLRDSELWGMIVCHHQTPRSPDANQRALCELLGQLMSLLLIKASESVDMADRLGRQQIVARVRADLEGAENVGVALSRQGQALLDVMGAQGAVINIGQRPIAIGRTPPLGRALELMGTLRRTHGEDIVTVGDAGLPGAAAQDCADTASGVLLMPILNNPDDSIAWFRPEQVHTVAWGGDPSQALQPGAAGKPLSPRQSFAAWTEIVRGLCVPWTPVDIQLAQDLRRVVMAALLTRAEAQLARLSSYDPLTTLANRRTLRLAMDRCVADRSHDGAAMLFLDLDRFKGVNDTLGHAVGDQVLIEVAGRLQALTPADAVAGRLGGDEFVVFWPGAAADAAEALAADLLKALAEPILANGQTLHVSASIGVAWSDMDGVDRLMHEADEAMYASKRQGGGGVLRFQPGLHAKVTNTMRLEQDMFWALERDEFRVHYQPILKVQERGIAGFEALARWEHPQRGWVAPAEFIATAERTGLITRIGGRMLAEAVRQLAIWRGGGCGFYMSINVSAIQLMDSAFLEQLQAVLSEEGVDPALVCLEVTETVLMNDVAVHQLNLIRAVGVKIALDDFGTGYSSLSYLHQLPIDVLKIDKSFVRDLGANERANRIFRGIVDLARTLDLTTVAEGCETESQWQVIREAGCDVVQGWLFAKPMPPAELDRWLRAPGLWEIG